MPFAIQAAVNVTSQGRPSVFQFLKHFGDLALGSGSVAFEAVMGELGSMDEVRAAAVAEGTMTW